MSASWKRGKPNVTCLVPCCNVSPQKSSGWLCDKCSKKWCRIWGHFSWRCSQRSCNYNCPLKLLSESSSLLAWQPAQCSVSFVLLFLPSWVPKIRISGSNCALQGCAGGLPPWDPYLQLSLSYHDLCLKSEAAPSKQICDQFVCCSSERLCALDFPSVSAAPASEAQYCSVH